MEVNYYETKHENSDGFSVLYPMWKELQLKKASSSPFMDPDRFIATAPRFNGFERFFVNIGYSPQQEPQYLSAFFVQSRPFTFKLGAKSFRQLSFQTKFLSTFNEGVWWTTPESEKDLTSYIMSCLNYSGIDGIYFQYMHLDDAEKIISLFKRNKLRYIVTSSSNNWIISIVDKELPEPIMRFSSKTRNGIRRKERKLIADHKGNLDFQIISSESQSDFFFSAIEKISENSWQRKLGMGIYDNQHWRKIFKVEAERKRLRCYILLINNTPISFIFGTIYNNIYNYEVLAYDQEYSKYSPGVITLKNALEDLYTQEVVKLDFGGGEEEYKAQWGTYCKPMVHIELYGNSVFSTSLWVLRKGKTITANILKSILDRLGLISRVYKWQRNRQRRIG